ncbi:amidohydrolase family protein [Roseateles toxinivorans]|uniref:Putative TIM-barrel fold metal-dependent hydrolase n=1 Tax=Roseateles toxinivorans TaxID=270368 RepID=A0A4R6QSD5_9BURK|nr:amidohydrolase family protein [Roseateles toxinivorans]TDP72721.1 putative TIM-barrel fold metal-dependent hydrolase [Roseateles toxinivorans]
MSTSPGGWDCHVHIFDAAAPVLAGHYRPATRTLAEIEARATAEDVSRLVLVQPSVYGRDNALLLRALQAGAGRHRGVAVVAAEVSDAELDVLHAAGVRGIRFNQVSPVGSSQPPADVLRRLAPKLRERGWHAQWYVRRSDLPALLPLQRETGLVFVLDHLAGIEAGTAADDPAWGALAALAGGGAWVKLSGWYRLNSSAPFDTMHAPLQRVARLFGGAMVWGSDWPHTSLDPAIDLPYATTWQPVRAVLSGAQADAVRLRNPLQLYG